MLCEQMLIALVQQLPEKKKLAQVLVQLTLQVLELQLALVQM
jgi:hypothetical protein